MAKYKVYRSNSFDNEISKLDEDFKKRVDKIEEQLSVNPYAGSPLDVSWMREKRYGKYRIYYIIYDTLEAVFMVAISEKKDQQRVINTIKFLLEFFREELESLVDKGSI